MDSLACFRRTCRQKLAITTPSGEQAIAYYRLDVKPRTVNVKTRSERNVDSATAVELGVDRLRTGFSQYWAITYTVPGMRRLRYTQL
jgi:hypothetical protein